MKYFTQINFWALLLSTEHSAFLWNAPNSRNINITVIVGFKSNLVEEKRKPSWRKILQQMKIVEGSFLISQTQREDFIQCHVGLPVSSMVWQCSHVLKQGSALSGKWYQTCTLLAFSFLFSTIAQILLIHCSALWVIILDFQEEKNGGFLYRVAQRKHLHLE